ncbi:MAG: metal-dependent hydrolase [Bacteroidia bacterium]|jgi:L-ascorbate metabolism protein UlaG (beta-lactamase superfamily)|nr:metal-dependent hydrolase [Bacteroidia bacterium]GIV23582.1 MAG: UPF0173 metal-dependent hydrolase [Bacteroidia bacterium]
MQIQYLGHSAFLITASTGERLLFDPFITPNPLAKDKVRLEDLRPDYIFLSHAHFDHIADAETLSKAHNAPIIGVWEIHSYFEKRGCPTYPMNVGGTWSPKKGSELWVKLVPAMHTSSFPDGSYGGVPVGFLISDGKYTVYYAGDTALTLEMELLAERYVLDLAFLPIGGTFTMDVEDAVEAALLLDVAHVVGMHYNTFPPIQIEAQKAQAAFKENDIELHLLEIGATLNLATLAKDALPQKDSKEAERTLEG